jgi:hypothetical protein
MGLSHRNILGLHPTGMGLLGCCWQPIHIFHCLISCLHLCLANFKFSSYFSNKRNFHFLRHLHFCLREVFMTVSMKTSPFEVTFRSLSETVMIFLSIYPLHLPFCLSSCGYKDFRIMLIRHSYIDCLT